MRYLTPNAQRRIGVLICGSFVPPVYYGFYCDDALRSSYLVTIVFMSVMASVPSSPRTLP